MPQLPTHLQDNFLNEVRAALICAPAAYKEILCNHLGWSLITFYKNTGQAKEYTLTEVEGMLKALMVIITNLEDILIELCQAKGFINGNQIEASWLHGYIHMIIKPWVSIRG